MPPLWLAGAETRRASVPVRATEPAAARLEGIKNPCTGGAEARAAVGNVALATAGQDSRRRATNQVIQPGTASVVAVL